MLFGEEPAVAEPAFISFDDGACRLWGYNWWLRRGYFLIGVLVPERKNPGFLPEFAVAKARMREIAAEVHHADDHVAPCFRDPVIQVASGLRCLGVAVAQLPHCPLELRAEPARGRYVLGIELSCAHTLTNEASQYPEGRIHATEQDLLDFVARLSLAHPECAPQ